MDGRPAPVTVADVLRLAGEIVAERGPDFRYKRLGSAYGCFYAPVHEVAVGAYLPHRYVLDAAREARANPDDPRNFTGCLVGEILSRHGFTEHRCASGTVSSVYAIYPFMIADTEALGLLKGMQRLQDRGETWSSCLAWATDAHGTFPPVMVS